MKYLNTLIAAYESTPKWEVKVSNVGTVFYGSSVSLASATFSEYKELSQTGNPLGKLRGATVQLCKNGKPVETYEGKL